jgi:hypothetical protein
VTGMDDLVTWLRAQLDEDAEAAQVADALTRSPWTGGDAQVVDGDGYPVVRDDDARPERAVLEHIARWDPARMLAEIGAKRRILDDIVRNDYVDGLGNASTDGLAHRVLAYLALPYAGRDGWREEWTA